ncbi:MAG: polysaccharide deacetylase family protein [Armatimonadota bacterium]
MASKKKSKPNNPEQPLLLITLTIAVVIGAVLGTYLARSTLTPGNISTSHPPHISSSWKSPLSTGQRNKPVAVNNNSEQTAASRANHPLPIKRSNQTAKVTITSEPASSKSTITSRPVPLTGVEIAHTNTPKMVALTFDAGASGKPTLDILNTLKDAGLSVTFFLTGQWCEHHTDLVRKIVEDGHEIANHSYSHPDLRKLDNRTVQEEITRTEQVVQRITGHPCAPYFRPPYGSRDQRIISLASQLGYTCIYWSVDSWDAFKKGITVEEVKERVLTKTKGGDIVLMHCGSWATAKALPDIISTLESRGYKIVRVSELLGAQ